MVRLASPPVPTAPDKSAPADGLAAPLQSALNSLNVQIEQELARYRQGRRGELPSARSAFPKGPRSLDLITIQARPSTGASTPPPPPNPRLVGVGQPPAQTDPLEPALPATAVAGLPPLTAPGQAAYGPIPTKVARRRRGRTPSTPWSRTLKTPVGVGALLLLLTGSLGLGFLAANPTRMNALLAYLPFVPSPEEAPGEGSVAVAPETDSRDRPFQPLEPDLSRREFAPLDLSRLSTLPSRLAQPDASPLAPEPGEASATDSETPETPDTVGATEPETPRAAASLETREATPAPQASATAPQAATPAPATPSTPATAPARTAPATPPAQPQAQTQYYYVVADYTGDGSLAQARQVVADAYVRNFPVGARIQLGAFNSQADATTAVQRLQNQGLTVQVYRP